MFATLELELWRVGGAAPTTPVLVFLCFLVLAPQQLNQTVTAVAFSFGENAAE